MEIQQIEVHKKEVLCDFQKRNASKFDILKEQGDLEVARLPLESIVVDEKVLVEECEGFIKSKVSRDF